MQGLHSGLVRLAVSAARRKAHIGGGEDRKESIMLDFHTAHPVDTAVQPVPGLDYFAPETARRPRPVAADRTGSLRPELDALAQMYGYWTRD